MAVAAGAANSTAPATRQSPMRATEVFMFSIFLAAGAANPADTLP
jgi:hypothetical protein